jgi:hypothetical protein
MMNPINDILDDYSIQSSNFAKEFIHFSMMELVKEVYDLNKFLNTGKNLDLRIENSSE